MSRRRQRLADLGYLIASIVVLAIMLAPIWLDALHGH